MPFYTAEQVLFSSYLTGYVPFPFSVPQFPSSYTLSMRTDGVAIAFGFLFPFTVCRLLALWVGNGAYNNAKSACCK